MFKLNKKFLLAVVILNIMTFSIVGCSKDKSGKAVVAKVNDEEITQEEFDREFNMFKNMYEQQFGEDALSQETEDNRTIEDLLKENILEKLVIEKVVSKDVKDLGIKVPQEEIDAQLKSNIESLGGKEGFKKFLEENNFTEEIYKENLTKEMLYHKYEEEFIEKTEIPEDEIKGFYDENKEEVIEVRASHILVETEDEGNKVIEKLESGEEFGELATTESMDSNSAVQGGDLGYFTRQTGMMGPEFTIAAFELKPGDVSELVKTELGYHVILLEDRKDSYEDLKENITSILKNEKYVKKIQALKDGSDIEIFMENDSKKK